ncbi:uncharacterized protein LOC131475475 [Solea solea]|uniref:uncharacterized protein LOC131475475 n=1 Tax=Solea solea TaxID=90069 RepID=UPI00272C7402|nr:uncharacterized protein LOC131475475 [Solea solea]XP_058509629.1 uncharacterized protein LOC131475475 [Solea solea]
MFFSPTFHFEPSSNDLTLRPTAAAVALATKHRQQTTAIVRRTQRPDVLEAEARARACQKGDGSDEMVLAETELQFGQYCGQTFRWLLENDVGYAVSILASHKKEREEGMTMRTPLMANKDALASYAGLFPPMVTAIARRRLGESSKQSTNEVDDTLLGFGEHAHRSYKSLYNARDRESRTYVDWLRKQKKLGAGSRMHTFQNYVLARDKKSEPQPGTSSCDLSDAKMLAVVAEVDSPSTSRDTPTAVVPSSSLSSSEQPLEGPEPGPGPRPEPGPGPVPMAPKKPASGKELLPVSWRQTLPVEQQEWVGRALFKREPSSGKVVLTTPLKLWWHPPGPRPLYTQLPANAHDFFQRPFFLWMPYRMWAYRLKCPADGRKLMGAGLYKTVRRVLDMSGWYFMATEYLECPACHKKIVSWSRDILDQLDLAHRNEFPAVLTYKLSCDMAVIGLLKERTLGNGVARLRASLVEHHSREWMARTIKYLSVLDKLMAPGAAPKEGSLPELMKVPGLAWFGWVYVLDAMTRLDTTKAKVTSIFGDILKMDSTKKITKKLAGTAAGSAAWMTNVGNEYGQVLVSVLTAAEGDGLANMAAGLMRRYREAGKAPPKVMYVDRDCCAAVGTSSVHNMYHEWHELVVRLDVWHLMRRFARGVTTDSHQLYGLFMARLSFAIFEWDAGDVARLREAKQSVEGKDAHIKLSAKELARHCRRRTRGAAETERLLREVLDAFWDLTDSMGVPLIDRDRMEEIWSTQRCHLHCIQDPEGLELYAQTGELTKGGVKLPVYRCARGSTSLKSFHLHRCRFIPGTSASDLHFQVYLLEGLMRWNENRGRAAVQGGQRSALQCYSAQQQSVFNRLAHRLKGLEPVVDYTQPREYTGELLGVEYLYSQSGAVLQQFPNAPEGTDEDEDEDDTVDGGTLTDEGFEEEEPEEIRLLAHHDALLLQEPHSVPVREASSSQLGTPPPPVPPEDDRMEVQQAAEEDEDVVGPDGHPGYHHVVALAHGLVELRHHAFVTARQSREVVALWEKLTERDKAPVTFPRHHQDRLVKGRFKTSNQHAHTPGVESVKRVALGQGAGAAQSPKVSRLVEAIMLELCRIHTQDTRTIAGVRINRWAGIMRDYKQIRHNVVNCPALMACTRIQLFDVNQRTLSMWHNERSKALMRDTIALAVPGPSAPQAAAERLPAPRAPLQDPQQPDQPLEHHVPADASGLAVTIRGPLAPELFDLIVDHQSATTSSASATTTSSSSADTTTTTSTASTKATAPTVAPATIAPAIPRSTAWRRRVHAEMERRAQELGNFAKPYKKVPQFMCRRCGQPKTKQYGHSRYKRGTFCAQADGGTVEQWLSAMKDREREEAAAAAAPTPANTIPNRTIFPAP